MDREHMNTNETPEEGGESFEDLFEASYVEPTRLSPGQKVKATVIKVTSDWVFIDMGRKGEGVLDRKELLDAEGNLRVKDGDTIDAYFVSSENNEMLFTTRIGRGAAGNAQMEEAHRTGIPVEGSVEREIKGGFEIRIAGGVRAFCPFSQMGLPREDEGGYVGKRLSFRVVQYGERGRNIVVSRRVLLEEERQARLEALKGTLKEGMTVRGTITSLRDFGAFVNVQGIEGLIPISEVGWGRTENIHDVLGVGQEVDVVIAQLDWVKNRFSFSLRAALADPWVSAVESFPAGSVHAGKVVRLAPFGAFVALAPGIDGLLHISRLGGGKRIKHPGEAVKEGQAVEVKVESVDVGKRRLSLALAGAAQPEAPQENPEEYRQYLSGDSPSAGMGSLGEALRAKLAEKGKK